MSPVNRCRNCGATSYKPIISRDETGGMRASGQYRCVGCNFAFASIDDWRVGGKRGEDLHLRRESYAAEHLQHEP